MMTIDSNKLPIFPNGYIQNGNVTKLVSRQLYLHYKNNEDILYLFINLNVASNISEEIDTSIYKIRLLTADISMLKAVKIWLNSSSAML